jgi:hypothetical protein
MGTSTPRAIAARRSSLRSLRTRKNVYIAAIGIPKIITTAARPTKLPSISASSICGVGYMQRRVKNSYARALKKFRFFFTEGAAPWAGPLTFSYKTLQNYRISFAALRLH